jgi:hypothetical protein
VGIGPVIAVGHPHGAGGSAFVCPYFPTLSHVLIILPVLLAIICFITPVAYQWFLIAGLVPFSISCILSAYFIVHVVLGPGLALATGIAATVPIVTLWWLLPIFRVHDLKRDPEEPEE